MTELALVSESAK